MTLASAYSAYDEGNFCPGFPQTRKADLTVGSDLVPCGAYIRICLVSGKKCVVAQRRDWGPFTGGRHIDMNLGVVWALGHKSIYQWGVRKVRWEPVDGPARTVASTRPPRESPVRR
jgi:rare lipoprotein A (peptidoglycan hydrolase)